MNWSTKRFIFLSYLFYSYACFKSLKKINLCGLINFVSLDKQKKKKLYIYIYI